MYEEDCVFTDGCGLDAAHACCTGQTFAADHDCAVFCNADRHCIACIDSFDIFPAAYLASGIAAGADHCAVGFQADCMCPACSCHFDISPGFRILVVIACHDGAV